MLLKSQIPLKPNNYSILSINRNRFRSPSRQSQNSSKSPRQLRKRFTPTVNKSFSAYEENTPIKFRSPSVDRTLKSSTAETGSKKRRNRSLKATTKISMFLEEREAQLDNGKTLMRKGNYKEAINYFNEIIRDDRTNFDAIYSRAVCFMHLKEHKMALPDLLLIEKENPMYDRQLYLALCSCFMLMTEMSTSLRYISKGIYKFPRFIEGLVLRGQIYVELQQFEKAMADFKKVLTYNSNETQSLIGLADSLNALGDYEGALEYIEKAIVIPQCYLSALLRRAKIQSEKEPEFALDDYNKYLSHKSEDPEAYLGKAMILFNLKQYSEAALCFEQVVKYDANQKYSEISIYHLGAIKIREKDFYGALHTFNRLDEGKELKGQKILRCYADAVIFMMKRKYKEGINLFSKLLKKEYTVLHEYKGNCYTYRAYGHNALNQHEKALSDLKKARNYLKLDNASKYNQKLSQGLLAASKKNYQSATKYFQKAHIIFPKNPEPEIYHAAILLKLAFDSKSADPSLLEESESLIFKASKKREIESEVYFFRSILRYLNGNPKEALEDCKLAIEKAEDNISEHYVFKGLINASLNLYQEAVQDFSIGYQLNEDQDIVLLYRGKCAYMMDDTTLAFTDFQKLCELNPKNLQYQIQKANLFILTGSYDDAIKALDEALEIDPQNLEAAYQKLKTCILMNDLEESCSQIRNVLEIKPSHKTAQFDLECLKYLKWLSKSSKSKEVFKEASENCHKWIENDKGDLFELKYLYWLKGVFHMYAEDYESGLFEFQKVLEIIHERDVANLNSDEALIAEEENCEILYNIGLCHLESNKTHSLQIFSDLSKILNSKHRGQMLFLCALIEITLNNTDSAEALLKDAFRCDQDSIKPFLSNEVTTILPLNTNNEFASKFEYILLPFSNQPLIKIRPALSLPRVKLPSMNLERIETRAKDYFTISKVTPKPEAPWLNRVRGSIQFTELIVDIETEPNDESDEETKPSPQKDSNSDSTFPTRHIKSMMPLRHNSSSSVQVLEDTEKLVDSLERAEERYSIDEKDHAPDEVLKRIKAICKPV